jgi:hypothetical protein
MFVRRCGAVAVLVCLGIGLEGCASPSIVSIAISPSTQTFVGFGGKAQMTAIGTYRQGDHIPTTRDVTDEVTWASSGASVATVSTTGMVATNTSYGTTVITASLAGYTGDVIGNASVTVCLPSSTNPTVCSGQ